MVNHTLSQSILDVYTFKEKRSEDQALAYLYETLIYMYSDPQACEEFLDTLMTTTEFSITDDMLIHTLNAYSPIKKALVNWKQFVVFVKTKIINTEGEDKAELIFRFLNY